jgi:hypothetical protein
MFSCLKNQEYASFFSFRQSLSFHAAKVVRFSPFAKLNHHKISYIPRKNVAVRQKSADSQRKLKDIRIYIFKNQ